MIPLLFELSAAPGLSARLAEHLPCEIGELSRRQFPDGETFLRFDTPIDGRQVILLCTLDRPDTKLASLLFAASATREHGARSIGLVAPYLAYMRQDKEFRPGEVVTSRLFAQLISEHFDWLVTIDPHLHRYRALGEIYSIPSVTATATDAANNTSPASNALSVTIDTAAPAAPSTPDLVNASDSGLSITDDVTNDSTPTVSGAAEANASVTVFVGATSVGSGGVVSGAWSITTSTLADGVASVTARATDLAGNQSAASAALAITVDTVAPSPPSTPDLDPLSDSGVSNTDDITNDPTPTIRGSAETGATVTASGASAVVGTATATGGAWAITTSPLTDGIESVSARATDLAGNQSTVSSSLSLTIDTVAPATPGVPDLVAASDSGASETDDLTNDPTPTLRGSAPLGTVVQIIESALVIATGTADAAGYEATTSILADGAHAIAARAIDAAGNTSMASTTLALSVDLIAPSVAFTAPTGFASLAIHEYAITWTEDGTGSAVDGRSIQRQSSPALTGGNCDGLTFAADEAAITTASPREDSGLADNTCYRWEATVTDVAGNQGVTTSAAVQTNLSGTTVLRLRMAPASAVGATNYMSIAVENGAGQPKDSYFATLTISSNDAGAVFLDGTAPQLTAANKEAGATFRVLFSSPGTHTVTVTGPNATSSTASVVVAAASLRAAAPPTVYQNIPFKLAVVPRIGSKTAGAINKAYGARVTFSSSDGGATFGQEVNASNQYTFLCNCEGARVFATTLTALGAQTLTVTDQFGVTDTITVNVVAPTGTATGPITRIDTVQWPQGNTVDYYITANGPYQLLAVTDSCGLINRRLSESSGSIGSSVAGGGGMARLLGDPNSSIHDGILPPDALLEDRQYAEGSLRMTAENGGCGPGNFSEASPAAFTYTDGAGHVFSIQSQRFRVFSDVVGSQNFVQQGPDAPIVTFSTVSRGGSSSSLFTDPNTGGQIRYVPGGLVMRFQTRSPVTVYRVEQLFASGFAYNLGPGFSTYKLPTGTSTVAMNDVPYHNSCLQSWDLNPGRIYYTGADGRTGMISSTGLWPSSTFPNPGPPTGWGCDQKQGQPEPPEPNNPLRDAFDKLGLDDTLAMVDAVGSLTRMTFGDPVDVATGAQTGEAVDVSLGGRTPFLSFSRRYRSDVAEAVANDGTPAARADGFLGIGWASSLDWKLNLNLADDQIIVRGDGAGAVTFRKLDNGAWSGPAWFRMELSASGGGYLLLRPAGDGYRFDGNGRLIAVRAQQGSEMTLAYDANGRLDMFTDASSRTADVTTNTDGHITRIDLPDGRYVAYTYSAAGFLASVRMLDGKTMTHTTDIRGRITKITDTLGRTVLSNTLDGRGRVIRQTDALGYLTAFAYDRVNLVTLTYGPRGDVTITCLNPDGTTRATLDALDGFRDYRYDGAGRTLAATDELGNRSRYRYDVNGNTTSVIDAIGQTVVTAFDAKARPTTMTGIDGSTVTTTYDAVTGGPQTMTRRQGTNSLIVGTYAYNALGLPQTLGEPGGATTTLLYDSRGYLRSSTDAEGRETTFVTDARGYVTSEVGPLGNAPGGIPADHTTIRTYDDLGRILTVRNALNQTWTYTYDEMGRQKTITTPGGAVTTNVYDVKGQLTSMTTTLTASSNALTTYAYDAAGNVTAIVDPETRRTEFTYDLLDRLTKTRDAAGNDWLTSYDAAGRVTRETDPTGRSLRTTYDAIGRVMATIDAAGKTTTYGYDGAGRLQSRTDPLGNVTTYGYDWMGRQDEVINAKNETASVVFSAAGDIVSVMNGRGKTTTFALDDTHRLRIVTEPGAISTSYAYDAAGRLQSRTNDRGAIETYAYDALGRPTGLIDPVGKTWTVSYDADGNVDATIDGKGQTVDYAFDLGGRLLSLTPQVGSPITFTYDDGSRVESMTDSAGTTTYGYDAVGRLTSAIRAGRTTTYGYDDAGRPTSVAYPASGGTVSYAYDPAGRLETITDWAGRTTGYTYDDASRVTAISRPGGLATAITYDALDRPTAVSHTRGGSTLLSQAYGYDANGNLASYGDDAGTATFSYDDLDRLTGAAFPAGQTYAYAYDPVGNLLSATTPAGTTTRTYDLADRITDPGFSSDANGNLTADPTRTYGYDGFGRLTGSTAGSVTTTYTLDGAGRRLAETTGASTTSFDLDLSRANPTILADGTRRYLPGDPSAGYEQAGTWYSALADQAGSPHSLVSEAGVQGTITRWDPYGAARPGSSVTSGIGYAGEWRDATGLVNLRARAYDPAAGRFTGRDGFGGLAQAPQSANRYSYAQNGPYRYADPSGRFVNAVYAQAPLLLSLAVQSLPIVGDLYSVLTGTIGYDPIAGIRLSDAERALAIGSVAVIGGGFHLLARLGDGLADSARLGRAADAGTGLRAGDGPGGALTSSTTASTYAGVREASAQLRSIGIPRGVRKQWLESFDVRTIAVRKAGPREFGLRFYDNATAQSRGATLFRTFPASRSSLAIKHEWNQMTEFIQFQIRPGSILLEGKVASQGRSLAGGDVQLVLPTWRRDLIALDQ